jgi:hypothetical protein
MLKDRIMGKAKKVVGWAIGIILIAIGIGFVAAFIPDLIS